MLLCQWLYTTIIMTKWNRYKQLFSFIITFIVFFRFKQFVCECNFPFLATLPFFDKYALWILSFFYLKIKIQSENQRVYYSNFWMWWNECECEGVMRDSLNISARLIRLLFASFILSNKRWHDDDNDRPTIRPECNYFLCKYSILPFILRLNKSHQFKYTHNTTKPMNDKYKRIFLKKKNRERKTNHECECMCIFHRKFHFISKS